jgi:hypothetical protein
MSTTEDIITRLETENFKLITRARRLQTRVDELEAGGCLDPKKKNINTCVHRLDAGDTTATPCEWCRMVIDLRLYTRGK